MTLRKKIFIVTSIFLLISFISVAVAIWSRRNRFMCVGAGWGKLGLVKFAYMIGADVNGTVKYRVPLNIASNIEIVEFLVKKGANVNLCDEEGKTPLMWASWAGRTEIVEFLIKNGADISAEDKFGETALFKASRNKNPNITILLLKHGANINHKCKDGRTPLMAAVNYYPSTIKNVETLIENGADVNAVDNKGESVLDHAIKSSKINYCDEYREMSQKIIQILKDHGAKTGAELKAP